MHNKSLAELSCAPFRGDKEAFRQCVETRLKTAGFINRTQKSHKTGYGNNYHKGIPLDVPLSANADTPTPENNTQQINNIQDEIDNLVRKDKNMQRLAMGIGLAGSVGGLLYAIKKDKSFWGKVGWWFLGGLITGVPSGTIIYFRRSKLEQEKKKLERDKTQLLANK